MTEVNASIITIGDELLIGQTIDTNSAFIAQELNKIGVWVRRRVATADDKQAILATLAEEAAISNIVIITGGLGPTADDITKPALCDYFTTEMRRDEAATENVRNIFQKLNRPITERNLSQGLVPANCQVLPNGRGTAPGMYFSEGGVSYFSLPGVPHEMKGLMQSGVIPQIKKTFTLPTVVHRTLLTAGIGESFLADSIQSLEESLPSYIKLAYLPSYGMVKLRLTGRHSEKDFIEEEVNEAFAQLKKLVAEWLVAEEDISIQQALINLLKEKGKTVATAESCTGGYIAHLLTSIAGSSAVYNGSVISYSNEAKENLLSVKKETLQSVGAVSEETVLQMAVGACQKLNTDYAVATSGIMGPDGGSTEKPVGTVWIGVANKSGEAKAQKFSFRFDRSRNIELTAHAALNMLRKYLIPDPSSA